MMKDLIAGFSRRPWLWIPALVFVIVNLGFLLAYRLVYSGEGKALTSRLESREAVLAGKVEERESIEELLASARANRADLETLFDERFATESERFTRLTAEIKDLASRAGLRPPTIAYPEEEIEDFDLHKRSFVFSVEGTYPQLRQFINLLELTPSFVTLEDIGLNEAEGPLLKIRLELSTLFLNNRRTGAGERAAG